MPTGGLGRIVELHIRANGDRDDVGVDRMARGPVVCDPSVARDVSRDQPAVRDRREPCRHRDGHVSRIGFGEGRPRRGPPRACRIRKAVRRGGWRARVRLHGQRGWGGATMIEHLYDRGAPRRARQSDHHRIAPSGERRPRAIGEDRIDDEHWCREEMVRVYGGRLSGRHGCFTLDGSSSGVEADGQAIVDAIRRHGRRATLPRGSAPDRERYDQCPAGGTHPSPQVDSHHRGETQEEKGGPSCTMQAPGVSKAVSRALPSERYRATTRVAERGAYLGLVHPLGVRRPR